MKKILVIMVLLVFCIGSIGLSQVLADGLDQVYLPAVMNGLVSTPVPTPTIIPTTTPAPNPSPIFTNFYAWGSAVNYEGTIKNIGPRPITYVVISVVARCSFGGLSSSHSYITSTIQPGDTANFGGVVVIICQGNINVTASIESWVQQ